MFDPLYDDGSFGGWRKDGADTGSFGVRWCGYRILRRSMVQIPDPSAFDGADTGSFGGADTGSFGADTGSLGVCSFLSQTLMCGDPEESLESGPAKKWQRNHTQRGRAPEMPAC